MFINKRCLGSYHWNGKHIDVLNGIIREFILVQCSKIMEKSENVSIITTITEHGVDKKNI